MRHEEKWHRLAAIFLGASLGLMADELGLMLTCGTAGMECLYHGRFAYDTIIIISMILLNIIYFMPFWKIVAKPILYSIRIITPKKLIKSIKALFK